jgi:hypothetical protein
VIPNDQLKILLHPKFNFHKQQHDIALIKLNKPVEFKATVHPIRLSFDKSWIPKNLTLTGWIDNNNNIHNPLLKEEVIPTFSVDFCNENTNREFKDEIIIASFQKETVPNQFCGGLNGKLIILKFQSRVVICLRSKLVVIFNLDRSQNSVLRMAWIWPQFGFRDLKPHAVRTTQFFDKSTPCAFLEFL